MDEENQQPRARVSRSFIFSIIIVAAIIGLLAWIFSLIPVVGFVFSIIFGLVGLVVFGLMILGIVNSVNGQAKQLPLVGKFTIFKLQ